MTKEPNLSPTPSDGMNSFMCKIFVELLASCQNSELLYKDLRDWNSVVITWHFCVQNLNFLDRNYVLTILVP